MIGLLKLAGLAGVGSRKGAPFIPEELALHQVLRNGGAVYLDVGLILTWRMLMNSTADHVFANTALAGEQHRGTSRRDARDSIEYFAHGRAAADDIVELIARIEFLAQPAVLVLQALHRQHLLQDSGQVVERKRLLQEISGAHLHGFDSIVNRTMSSHDNDTRSQAAR